MFDHAGANGTRGCPSTEWIGASQVIRWCWPASTAWSRSDHVRVLQPRRRGTLHQRSVEAGWGADRRPCRDTRALKSDRVDGASLNQRRRISSGVHGWWASQLKRKERVERQSPLKGLQEGGSPRRLGTPRSASAPAAPQKHRGSGCPAWAQGQIEAALWTPRSGRCATPRAELDSEQVQATRSTRQEVAQLGGARSE